MPEAVLAEKFAALQAADLHQRRGKVVNLIGLVIEASGLRAEVGELCTIDCGRTRPAMALKLAPSQ